MSLLLVLACSDYFLHGEKNTAGAGTDPVDTAIADSDPLIVDSNDPEPLDTDCEPSSCEVEVPPAGAVEILEACEALEPVPVTDPWNLETEWHWQDLDGVWKTAGVANFTDDDGDGDVDEDDIPDVVVVAGHTDGSKAATASIVLLDGATGLEHWRPRSRGGRDRPRDLRPVRARRDRDLPGVGPRKLPTAPLRCGLRRGW